MRLRDLRERDAILYVLELLLRLMVVIGVVLLLLLVPGPWQPW